MTDRYDAMVPRERNGKTYWTRVGTMFPTRSGNGFQLVLDALPLPDKDGRCVISMFEPKPRDSDGGGYQRQQRPVEDDLDGDSVPF